MQHLLAPELKIENLSEADDTRLMKLLLTEITRYKNQSGQMLTLQAGNAGTVYRFLVGLLSITQGVYELTGDENMLQRPVGPLVRALSALGADITYLREIGYPPLLIKGNPLKGGEVVLNPQMSSQFVSALMLIAPALPEGLTIKLASRPVSEPYIDMTAHLLEQIGCNIKRAGNSIRVYHGVINHTNSIEVEPDWSAAACWYQLVALSEDAEISLSGLSDPSMQGDSYIAEIFNKLGVETIFKNEGVLLRKTDNRCNFLEIDFSGHPDLTQAVAATCAVLGINGRFSGIKNLRYKEIDRIAALQKELKKVGASLSNAGTLTTQGIPLKSNQKKYNQCFDTCGDHRKFDVCTQRIVGVV